MGKKILVVDDEPDIVSLVKGRLAAAGYAVISAVDGQEGLDKARGEKPDLIVLDIMLPKMDGYLVCRLLKSDVQYQKIPIILFTVRDTLLDLEIGNSVKADAYITKPFEPEVLLEKVAELLRQPEETNGH
jgi:DNA-binding response OmpR family regulator